MYSETNQLTIYRTNFPRLVFGCRFMFLQEVGLQIRPDLVGPRGNSSALCSRVAAVLPSAGTPAIMTEIFVIFLCPFRKMQS
jgi:hypothetical protein